MGKVIIGKSVYINSNPCHNPPGSSGGGQFFGKEGISGGDSGSKLSALAGSGNGTIKDKKVDLLPLPIVDEIITNQSFVGRREKVKDKDYAIYPVVLMVEGVHHAINGDPVYYPLGAMQESVLHWDGRPIPVMHPNVGGDYVRANNPQVEADWVVGRIYNANVQDGKLKAEAWIEVKKANKIAPDLIMALDSGVQMEVSTGILIQGDSIPGKWNEEEFTQTIINMVPDHLALLPGDKGACSWEDGCGVRANQSINKSKEEKDKKITRKYFLKPKNFNKIQGIQEELFMDTAKDKLPFAINLLTELNSDEERLELLENMAFEFLGLKQKSFSEMEIPVRDAIRALNVPRSDGNTVSVVYEDCLVHEVYPTTVIYEKNTATSAKYFKRSYIRNEDGTVTLLDDIVEVKEQREFIPVNNEGEKMKETTPCCPEKVSALITNENTAFIESDREFLNNLAEEQMDKLFHTVMASTTIDIVSLQAKLKDLEDKLAANSSAKTAAEFIASAPPEFAAVLNAGLSELNKKKDALCKVIVANTRNTFTAEQLAGMDISQLESIAAFATITDFSVNGSTSMSQSEEETPYITETKLFA